MSLRQPVCWSQPASPAVTTQLAGASLSQSQADSEAAQALNPGIPSPGQMMITSLRLSQPCSGLPARAGAGPGARAGPGAVPGLLGVPASECPPTGSGLGVRRDGQPECHPGSDGDSEPESLTLAAYQ
eukprot:2764672-Rhodomonas_salina.1